MVTSSVAWGAVRGLSDVPVTSQLSGQLYWNDEATAVGVCPGLENPVVAGRNVTADDPALPKVREAPGRKTMLAPWGALNVSELPTTTFCDRPDWMGPLRLPNVTDAGLAVDGSDGQLPGAEREGKDARGGKVRIVINRMGVSELHVQEGQLNSLSGEGARKLMSRQQNVTHESRTKRSARQRGSVDQDKMSMGRRRRGCAEARGFARNVVLQCSATLPRSHNIAAQPNERGKYR